LDKNVLLLLPWFHPAGPSPRAWGKWSCKVRWAIREHFQQRNFAAAQDAEDARITAGTPWCLTSRLHADLFSLLPEELYRVAQRLYAPRRLPDGGCWLHGDRGAAAGQRKKLLRTVSIVGEKSTTA
jgi:hypothetical protein